MTKADYYVIARETYDEVGEEKFFIAYVYAESVKEEATKTQTVPAGWIEVYAAKNETTVLSRAHQDFESIILEYTDGIMQPGRVF